jgi:hypothetical protein
MRIYSSGSSREESHLLAVVFFFTGRDVYLFLVQKVLETLVHCYKKYRFCSFDKKAALSIASIDLKF